MNNNSIDFSELFRVVQIFRVAVEQYKETKPQNIFAKFPAGCCKNTSFLLSKYLLEKGFGKAQYVCGQDLFNKKFSTHGWLELDGVTIDITADQFGKNILPIIITTNNAFHSRFHSLKYFDFDSYMEDFHINYKKRFDNWYSSIICFT